MHNMLTSYLLSDDEDDCLLSLVGELSSFTVESLFPDELLVTEEVSDLSSFLDKRT